MVMSKIIIVGSNHANTAEYYKTLGLPASVLVTRIDHGQLIGHTCIQDISDHAILEIVLKNADEIYWAESNKDEFFDDDSYYDFLDWLKDYNLKYKNVKNFESIKFDPYKWPQNIIVDPDHAIFIGCSFTAGVGLSDPDTHYSTVVANHFNKKLLNLSQGGGSNNLIFDRFTQLDCYPGQLVVLQFTGLDRLHYCNTDKKLSPLLLSTSQVDKNLHRAMLEVYHKDFLFYELLCKIRAIVTIARAQKLKLVFWLIDYKHNKKYSKLDQLYFYNMPEFVPASWMADFIVDTAEDKSHPGIESNKNIAKTLIKYIETIYERRH
jgi:hypothetical protein